MASGFIRIDDSQLRELEGLFSGVMPRQLTRARRTALNRTRRGAKARVSQQVRTKGKKRYNLPAARVKKGLILTRIRNNESFNVIGSRKSISLTTFSGTRDLFRSRRGVSVSILKGQRLRVASAFIRQPRGGAQVFRRAFVHGRSGKQVGRTPIDRLHGPSIAQMMEQNEVENDLADFLSERFNSELTRAINFALRRR